MSTALESAWPFEGSFPATLHPGAVLFLGAQRPPGAPRLAPAPRWGAAALPGNIEEVAGAMSPLRARPADPGSAGQLGG